MPEAVKKQNEKMDKSVYSIPKVLKIIEKCDQEFAANRSLFQDAYDYTCPFRNVYNKGGQNHNRPTKQYDSTGLIAASNFVNTMHSKFTPLNARWANLKAGPGVPDAQRKAWNKELEKVTETVFAYLDASNFATETASAYFDLGVGTMALLILEGDDRNPIIFKTIPMAKFGITDGKPGGGVSALSCDHSMTLEAIKARWPNADIPQEFIDANKDDPTKEFELSEVMYWCEEELLWYQEVLVKKEKMRIWVKTHVENIAVVARWMCIPGFASGIGPFILALCDNKTLNKMREYMLQMLAFNVFGVYTVANNGTFNPNTARVRPGSFIPVERNGGPNGPSIAPLPRVGDFQVQEFIIKDLQDQVRQVMLDSRLPPENSPVRTAYEIAERIKELSTDIGAAFPRLKHEFVDPVFRRCVYILNKKGKIQLPKGFDIDNFTTQVQVVSPVALAQQLEDLEKFVKGFEIVRGMSPELALISYDLTKAVGWINEKLGSPASLLKDDDQQAELQSQVQGLVAKIQSIQAGGGGPQQEQPVAQ